MVPIPLGMLKPKSVVPSVVVPSYSVGMISEQESTLSPSTDILQLTGTIASSPAGTNTVRVDGKMYASSSPTKHWILTLASAVPVFTSLILERLMMYQ